MKLLARVGLGVVSLALLPFIALSSAVDAAVQRHKSKNQNSEKVAPPNQTQM